MKIENMVFLVLAVAVLMASMTGCPGLNPFKKKTPTPVVDGHQPPEQQKPEQAAQKWMVRGIPALFIAGLVALGLAIYFKNNPAFYISAICGGGLLLDIALLTYWKVIAVVILVIVLAAIAAGVTVVALWIRSKLILKQKLLKSLQDGIEAAKQLIPGEPNKILRTALEAAQSLHGTQEEMDISRGKDPNERKKPEKPPAVSSSPVKPAGGMEPSA